MIILRERFQVLYKDGQGYLEMCITNAIRRNNEEVVEDCMEACGDCTGTTRLYGHQRGYAGESELTIMCAKLYRSL